MSNQGKESKPKEGKPFNMLITGMTNCGKTYFLLKFLETKIRQFENIVLICPTFGWNETYLKWKHINDPGFYVMECDQDHVESNLKFAVDYCKGVKSLIILDDCAASKAVKNRTSELVKLGFGARHYLISTIVITQQLTSISKPFRENLQQLVSFYNPNRKDQQVIFDDFLNVSKTEEYEIKKELKQKKYSYLWINLNHPYEHEVKSGLEKVGKEKVGKEKVGGEQAEGEKRKVLKDINLD